MNFTSVTIAYRMDSRSNEEPRRQLGCKRRSRLAGAQPRWTL